MAISSPDLLYQPTNAHESSTHQFLARINAKFQLNLASYHDLYRWSTAHVDAFWSQVWDNVNVLASKGSHVVNNAALPSENPPWFNGAALNWAENMLHCRSADKLALIQATEPTAANPNPPLRQVTYLQLYDLVADLVSALLLNGIRPGDRVASYSSNNIENVAACLASAAVGAVWVSAAADFGPQGVLERFEQVQPRFIFAVDSVAYNGKSHHHIPKVATLLSGLAAKNIFPEKVIIIEQSISSQESKPQTQNEWGDVWVAWDAFVTDGQASKLGRTTSGEIEWHKTPFDYPLWILFSSGTTGRPKPIVHRAGGMLLQAKKEFVICGDLRPDDVFFYYTTTGWMMWNFLISGLSVGCTLVLYDGSPLKDPSYLWKLVDTLGITIFGTSAKYIDQLSKSYRPREQHSLASLRQIYSTGSPLAPPLFDYVYQHIHPTVLLGSITGGTDICSLFAGMCSALPVYRGEIQCRMLGMAIESYSSSGIPSPPGVSGELVCVRPFPCMPLGFWPLPGYGKPEDVEAAAKRFHQAYFSEYEGVWYHGDHILITPSRSGNGGGVVMLGRSDGVLNPGGIRFGSAELYDVLDLCFSSTVSTEDFVTDYLAIGQKIDGGMDERVLLFVKLPDGKTLSEEFQQNIKKEIRARRSPRHVPAKIVQVADIPYTVNGKRVEVLVKKIINGSSLSTVNLSTLANPDCLQFYMELGQRLREEVGC